MFETGTRPSGVHPLASVGGPPEHRDWMVGDPTLPPVVDASALVHAFCTVDAGVTGTDPRGRGRRPTTIGAGTFLQARVHVGHNAVIGSGCEICAGVVICGDVMVGDDVKIGGNSWVKPLVEIGDGAIIGGGSVVTKDVPAHEVWAGSPARYSKKSKTHPEYGLCECGCGRKTEIATITSTRAGWSKGEPKRFIHNHHSRRDLEHRFWSKVLSGTADECWGWLGAKSNRGYGVLLVDGKKRLAHRVSYEIHFGLPGNRKVERSCGTVDCVNPNHMQIGGRMENDGKCTICEKNEVISRKRPYCKDCSADRDREARFGIPPEEYRRLLEFQGGACAICKEPEASVGNNGEVKALAVDHDHATGHIRGLLCQSCNTGLGMFGDSHFALCAAADYLKRQNTRRNLTGQLRVSPQYDMTAEQWQVAWETAVGSYPSLGEILEHATYRPPAEPPHPDWIRGIT